MHKQIHKIMRLENHYVHSQKLSQKATKTGNRMAKVQCETCQRLLDKIFGDGKSKCSSNMEDNTSNGVTTPKTAQLMAQIQAIPHKIYKYKKLLTKSLGRVEDNPKDFAAKDVNKLNLDTDEIFLSHVIPEEIESKEVIQLVNQNRRLQKKHIVKRIERRNKPRTIKREKMLPNRISQINKQQQVHAINLTPPFEPPLSDKPLFKIVDKHNLYHDHFCKETILLEHKEYLMPTKYDTYYNRENHVIDNEEDLNVLKPNTILINIHDNNNQSETVVKQDMETVVKSNPADNYCYEESFPEVSLAPTFEPSLMDKPLSLIVHKHHFDHEFFFKENILLDQKEYDISTKYDNNFPIEKLHRESFVVANIVDSNNLKSKPISIYKDIDKINKSIPDPNRAVDIQVNDESDENSCFKEKFEQVNELQELPSTALTPTFEPHLSDKIVDEINIDHNWFCKETILLEQKEHVIPTKYDNYCSNKIESLHMENFVVPNVVDQNVLKSKYTSVYKQTDSIDEILKSDSVVKQAMETIVNVNAAPNCPSKEKAQLKKKVSLEALLKKVREENRNKSKGKKGAKRKNNKKPPCPPPPPSCPPDPPKPPCPMPCPKPSPKPTKCPQIPSDCPPPTKKCFHNLIDSNTMITQPSSKLNSVQYNRIEAMVNNEEKHLTNKVSNKKYLAKTIIEDILDNMIVKTLNVNICLLRSFEPWTPIPSWPIPKEMPKMESKDCKPTAKKISGPCKTEVCKGLLKRKIYI